MEDNVIRKRGTEGFRKTGVFGGYTVQGAHYCNETESLGWYITSWPGRDPVHTYWVDNGKFKAVKIGTRHLYSNQIEIEVLGPKDVSPEEKKASLQAIAEWTREIEESD